MCTPSHALYATSYRRPTPSAATADLLNARHHDLRTGAKRGQIEGRVVLLQQPQGQLRTVLAQRPDRVARPRDADLGTDDAVAGEVGGLELPVVLVTQRLEHLARHLREVQPD